VLGGEEGVPVDVAAEEADALRIERSGIFLVGAMLSIGLLAGSLLRHFNGLELLLRVSLTALLLGAPLLARGVSPARRNVVVASVLVASTLLICAIAALGGGIHSPEFSCLIAVPFTAGLILPHARAMVWTIGLLVLLLGGAMLLAAGAPLFTALVWTALLVAGTTVSTMGASAYVRMFESRIASERACREAAERLAESERRRAQSDRLALLGRLAAGVAHEISNPLTYLSTNLQLLEREAEAIQTVSRRDVQAAVTESARAVEQITDVVRDLRRFGRSEGPGEAGATDVRVVVEEAVLLASARLRGIKLERDLGQGLPKVLARRRRLVQVLVNLLINAADAVGERESKERRIRISANHAQGVVSIEVEDSGSGLSPEARARLFEPFFTTKPTGKGTGLGLALSREYVETDGGTLTVESVPPGGARAMVKLPST
jgi:C4-dicarboxylate-specific signal transduction histidine kinase